MLICRYCQKEINSRNHERLCKLNPDYEKNVKIHIEKCCKPAVKAVKQSFKIKSQNDPLNQIKTYTFQCIKCGKEYTLNLKVRDYLNSNYKKTCSSQCAHSRVLKDSTREKIRQSLKSKTYKHICIKCGKEFKSTSSSSNVLCKDCKFKNGFKSKNIGLHKINCKKCNKEIFVKAAKAEYCYECSDKLGYMRFQIYDQNGKKIVSEETKKKNSEISKRLMAEGKIKPWQTRNIKSYAERFFEKVLSLNKIQYTREKKVSKYFLDFVIETPKRIIDFEVDGKQHQTKERIESDKIRDQYLINNGYYVYRLSWNQINTIDGKKEMKKKISDFLLFYHNSF